MDGEWAYRAKVLVLHLLELGVGVAGAQLYVSQHHLEDSVVDGLSEVHVQLIHGRLGRKKKNRVMMGHLCEELDRSFLCCKFAKERKINTTTDQCFLRCPKPIFLKK